MIGFEDQESEPRFSRQQGLEGWDQPRLREAGCLVVGAGALGNELLKNLALLGVGELGVIDFDRVEESNLPRCTLFRQGDIGRLKALVAQEQLLAMAPGLRCTAYPTDVMTEVGAGLLEAYDLVLGAVDSVAARWQINRLARRAGVSWIDAGVDHFCGQVTRFDAASGACYECGMTARMWQHIFERHSCAAPAEASPLRPRIPLALPVVSVTAGLQAQEAVYLLMGSDGAGETPLQPGERLSISLRPYELLRLRGRRRSGCLAHAANNAAALPLEIRREDSVVAMLRTAGAHGLQLEWEVVYELRCTRCGAAECVLPSWQLGRDALRCPTCGSARTTEQTSMVSLESRLAACTLRELGVPAQAHLQLLVSKGAEPCWYKIL